MLLFVCSLLTVLIQQSAAFYLPGVAPTTYHRDDEIRLFVNHLTPSLFSANIDTNQNFLYSYDYYYPKLHFCKPQNDEVSRQPESLGSIIFGDRIYNSPFHINMLQEKQCETLCNSVIPGEDAKFVNELISNGFSQNWIIDGLPVARKTEEEQNFYGLGFQLGSVQVNNFLAPANLELKEKPKQEKRKNTVMLNSVEHLYFNNHYDIHIDYHEREDNEFRIVGITVEPKSMDRSSFTCDSRLNGLQLSETDDNDVFFTYSVFFHSSETPWATRWDKYLNNYNPTIEWFSLITFTIIVVVLSFFLFFQLSKNIKNDFLRYNEFNLDDNSFDNVDSGWKLNHGDVFRIPSNSMLLSILIGSGVQLFFMTTSILVLASLGFLSPSSRGSLPTMIFLLYAVFGFIGSYTSMGVYKFFNGLYWKANLILTPILVPSTILSFMIIINLFLTCAHSSDAIPFTTLLMMIFFWIIFSLPLSFAGSLISFKSCKWNEHPTKTSEIQRSIPFQPWYLKVVPASLIGGIFPFGSIAVELYFIYSSLWFNQIFYMFGFLLLSFLLLILTTALITILITYQSLSLENWKWQWRSFIIGGLGCSIYIFIHSILFTQFKLRSIVTIVLYVGYSFLLSMIAALITGSIGFMANMYFVRKIYSSIKVD